MKDKVIDLKNVGYRYADGTTALREVSFSVYRDDCLGLIGPNGAGKSTLLLQINGILKGSGIIKVLTRTISPATISDIRARVGMVFQDPNDQLFMPNIREDIAFGPMNFFSDRQDVETAVDRMISHLRLEPVAGKSAHQISLGQRKRAALATVLVLKPEVLIFDEPTASLDPGSRRSLISDLKTIRATKLIASHDLDLILELCNRTVLLSGGRVIASGESERILRNEKLLEKHQLETPWCLRKCVNIKTKDR